MQSQAQIAARDAAPTWLFCAERSGSPASSRRQRGGPPPAPSGHSTHSLTTINHSDENRDGEHRSRQVSLNPSNGAARLYSETESRAARPNRRARQPARTGKVPSRKPARMWPSWQRRVLPSCARHLGVFFREAPMPTQSRIVAVPSFSRFDAFPYLVTREGHVRLPGHRRGHSLADYSVPVDGDTVFCVSAIGLSSSERRSCRCRQAMRSRGVRYSLRVLRRHESLLDQTQGDRPRED